MRKKIIFFGIIIILISIFTFMYFKKLPSEIYTDNGINYSSKIYNEKFQVLKGEEWNDIIIKGVNIGMTSPGKWPGEAGITEDEYYRWLEYIGNMNANTIRTYTIHPPHFYEALKKYN